MNTRITMAQLYFLHRCLKDWFTPNQGKQFELYTTYLLDHQILHTFALVIKTNILWCKLSGVSPNCYHCAQAMTWNTVSVGGTVSYPMNRDKHICSDSWHVVAQCFVKHRVTLFDPIFNNILPSKQCVPNTCYCLIIRIEQGSWYRYS